MNSNPLSKLHCRICGSYALGEFERFRTLKRVTSDSRPWRAGGRLGVCKECGSVQKLVEPNWLEDIDQIYKSYAIYHQSGGKEQPIFTGGCAPPLPRSVALARFLDEMVDLPERAQVLDFGCGTGAALRTYSTRYPKWTLYGAELSVDNLASLREIPGFVRLFTCPPADIPMRFDLITSFHALEHVLEPVEMLRDLSRLLKDGGILFVQVPDVRRTPYDLVIADHLLHFTLETLSLAVQRAGCKSLEVTDAVLPKELTLIAQPNKMLPQAPARSPDQRESIDRVASQLDWLCAQAASANTIARDARQFGLFGTSISATWLASELDEELCFFVDEDEGRIGRQHMGRPIISPHSIDAETDVYVPLVPDIAISVVRRLSRPGVRFHAPPPLAQRVTDHQMANLC